MWGLRFRGRGLEVWRGALTLRLKIAPKPHIVWSLGLKPLLIALGLGLRV